jgi:serine/threonine-protein kinase
VVFDQRPSADSRADKGSTVLLRVSTGLGQVAVPDLTGKSEAAAVSLVDNADLVPDVRKEAHPTVPPGQVVSQDPAPGTPVEKGSPVTIVISSGPARKSVPGVGGMTVAEATQALTDAGFEVNQRSESSSSVPEGRVIRTEPGSGAQAEEGSTVTIIVSTGPPASSTTSTTSSTTSTSSTTTTTVDQD